MTGFPNQIVFNHFKFIISLNLKLMMMRYMIIWKMWKKLNRQMDELKAKLNKIKKDIPNVSSGMNVQCTENDGKSET